MAKTVTTKLFWSLLYQPRVGGKFVLYMCTGAVCYLY